MYVWILITAIICFMLGFLYCKKNVTNNSQTPPIQSKKENDIDLLKNALLSFALSKVYRDKIDMTNYQYRSFDGTKLPMFSGYDIANACFTYIRDKNTYINTPFVSQIMIDKCDAIDLFIGKNLGTIDDMETFFKTFEDIVEDRKKDIVVE